MGPWFTEACLEERAEWEYELSPWEVDENARGLVENDTDAKRAVESRMAWEVVEPACVWNEVLQSKW